MSPLVRKMAAEHSIDLSQVAGTGTGGRITKQDVQAVIAGGGTSAPAVVPTAAPAATPTFASVPTPAIAGAGEEVVPMSKVRKLIAEHMHTSLQTSARAWNMVEVNFENVVRVRERAKDAFKAREGISLTYTSFVSRATTDALLAFPQVNAELRGEDIVLKRYVNLGIAVSYDEGLIVPVIKGADTLNIVGLQRAITDLADRARSHHLKPDEITGGTFSITNPGPYGSMLSVPIIAQPQTAILAFDAIEKRPVVIDDAIGSGTWPIFDVVGPPCDRRGHGRTVPRPGEAEPRVLGLLRGPRGLTRVPHEAWLLRPAGPVPYGPANEAMHRLAERRLAGEIPDTLILLEHPPVFTAGGGPGPTSSCGPRHNSRSAARRSTASTAAAPSRSTDPASSSATPSSISAPGRTRPGTCAGWRRW